MGGKKREKEKQRTRRKFVISLSAKEMKMLLF